MTRKARRLRMKQERRQNFWWNVLFVAIVVVFGFCAYLTFTSQTIFQFIDSL